MTDKHPISKGQPSRDTTCWREHEAGLICMLPEGHAPFVSDPLADPVVQTLLSHDRVDDWGVMGDDELAEYVELAREIRGHIAAEVYAYAAEVENDIDSGDVAQGIYLAASRIAAGGTDD